MSFRSSFTALRRLLGMSLCLVALAAPSALAQTPTDSEAVLGLTEPPPYQVGQVLDLFAAFRSGPADALDAVLTVTASAGVTFLNVTPIHPTQPLSCSLNTPQEVVCTRAVVRGITEIFVQIRFDAPGQQTLTATVSQSNPDPNPNNNTVSGTVTVIGGTGMGAISGAKWHDLDQDGTRNGGEPGLQGWTIYVDENGNGQRDADEPAAVTGADGTYLLGNLDPNTYTVREEQQAGWQQTFPAGGAHTATVNADETTEGVDFGNYEVILTGVIGGQKFFDEDADGARDQDEPGLEGFTIYLDENNNGQRDANEPTFVTVADGFYLFDELAPATYTVREEVPSGWTQTFPAAGQHVVTLNPGDQVGGIDFGNVMQLIFGQKFFDINNNGAKDPGEAGLEGWTIYLDDNGNGQRDTDEPFEVTNQAGEYLFSELLPGTYTVREEHQTGWTQTFPAAGAHTITVNPGEVVQNVDFGNYQIVPMADFGIVLNATPTSAGKVAEDDTLGVIVGDTLAVGVTVDNNGPDDADNVTITVRLDGDGNVLIDTESIDTCGGRGTPSMPDGQTVIWDVNVVGNSESIPCQFKIFTVERGETTVNGTVTSTTDDPDLSNNNDGIFTVAEDPKLADLVVEKFVEPDTVFVGDTLTYIVSILNRGPDDAPNVRFSDIVFSDSLEFVASSLPAGCTLMQNNGQLDCTLASIAAGQTVSVSYQTLTKLAGTVTNLVTNLSSDLSDPDLSTNTASAKAFVSGGADLSVEKTAAFIDPTVTGVAAVIAYTVTVTNNGPETAFLVEADDLVFADSLEFVAASVPLNCTLGTATDDDTGKPLSTMTCRLAAILDAGESASVTYEAVTKQAGIVSNEVEVKGFPRDLNPSNNIAVTTTVVRGRTSIDFTLDASASTNTAKVGDEVTFTFSCTPDKPADTCKVTATTNDDWTNPTLGNGVYIAAGQSTPADGDETKTVEVDPEGFPSGTTQITYTFTGGYTDGGETYMGTFTLEANKPNPNGTIRFEASAPNNDDPNTDDDIIEILVNIDALATAIEQDPGEVPQAFRLHANYPNPFNPETTIRFDLQERARVRLQVFNALGQLIETLVDEDLATGSYRSAFDARGLPSGPYFYRIEAGAFNQTQSMILLK